MAASFTVTFQSEGTSGYRMIAGSVTIGVYETDGVAADLSSYFSGSPVVLIGDDDGYLVEHNRGTAAAGTIICRVSNSSANAALPQVDNDTNLANVVCYFCAFGTPA